MSGPSFNFKFLLAGVTCFLLTSEAKMLPSVSANLTREARQMVYLYPVHPEKVPQEFFEETQQQPRRSFTPSSLGHSTIDERFFGGLSNILGQRACPSCPSCPNCPVCQVCPTCTACTALCPGTTFPATPFTITVSATGCINSLAGATNFGACTRFSAAPAGIFTVTFPAVAPAAPFPTAFVNIIATCPNTKVTVTCGIVPASWVVITQSGQTIAPAAAGSLTENTAITLMVSQGVAAAAAGSLQCSWVANP